MIFSLFILNFEQSAIFYCRKKYPYICVVLNGFGKLPKSLLSFYTITIYAVKNNQRKVSS